MVSGKQSFSRKGQDESPTLGQELGGFLLKLIIVQSIVHALPHPTVGGESGFTTAKMIQLMCNEDKKLRGVIEQNLIAVMEKNPKMFQNQTINYKEINMTNKHSRDQKGVPKEEGTPVTAETVPLGVPGPHKKAIGAMLRSSNGD